MSNAQTHINKEWAATSGNPFALDWTSSVTNASNQLISIGNSYVVGEGANVLTTKYNKDGSLAWQRSYNTLGAQNEYGIALTTDDNDNIYVVGTTDNGGFTNYDVVLLKYNAVGALQWSRTFNTTFNKNDIGTGIKLDASGNIYICSVSEGATSNTDYLLLKYDASGTLQWNNRYDYASLTEIAVGVDIDGSGNPFVIGASASSANNWDFTVAKFDASGMYQNDVRNALSGVGFDQPLSYKKDSEGNIYITGKASTDGVNYDIKTIKFNPTFVLQWTKIIDFSGKEDVGNSIDVDAIGNVYIGGYTTKSNDKKEAFAVKYNANGNEVWRHEQSATNTTGDATIKAIDVTPEGAVYFVGEEKGMNGSEDVIISKINTTGNLEWQKKLSETVDEKPTTVKVADDGSIYVGALKGGAGNTYETVRYTEFKTSGDVIYTPTGKPICKANELIVRFQREALNINAIDDNIGTKKAEYGDLDYFLTPAAMDSFNNALAPLCNAPTTSHQGSTLANPCGIKAVKVFTDTKTTDTTTISRLGQTIPIPDFWTAFVLEFPDGMNVRDVDSILNTTHSIVRYAERNMIASEDVSCNDTEYRYNQQSLHAVDYPNAHINVEQAWDVIPSAGLPFVRCGVLEDNGIDWTHQDFGYNGRDINTSKVDGWNFGTNSALRATPGGGSHATSCAGIIGAIRNNYIGIAGIAGGNATGGVNSENRGVSLFSLIAPNFTISTLVNAIKGSSIEGEVSSGFQPYAYGLNILSNSWGTYVVDETNENNELLREAVHFANRAQVTVIASRGNDSRNEARYPATMDDDWVLSVGSTGPDGEYNPYANYGSNLDVAAPGDSWIVQTTKPSNQYGSFTGTSAAAPHVSGTVGLMMSYINSPNRSILGSSFLYNDLAPEDCENIIQLSATMLGTTRYSQYTGYGRLNAGAAMKLIEKPNNAVRHFGTNSYSTYSRNSQIVATNTRIYLKEGYTTAGRPQYFPKGYYKPTFPTVFFKNFIY